MSFTTSPETYADHPGLIGLFSAIPVALILITLFVILKGFNLFPTVESYNPCKWKCWSRLFGRDKKESFPENPSFSTIESSFVDQPRNETTENIWPPPRAVHHGTHPVNWRSDARMPGAPTYRQEEEAQPGPK